MSNTLTSPYTQRFEDLLKPLQSKLSELEQNLDSISDDHPYKQQARLDVLEEINKIKQDIENTKKNLESSKKMEIIRSDKLPSNIPDHNVWNDCWYDEERKLYVTFNEYFMEGEDAWIRPHQKQYTEETGIKAAIILPEQIEFRFGYPAMLQKDIQGRNVSYLLPTLSDSMLTTQMLESRFKPKTQDEAILYSVESEEWIEVLGTKLSEREYLLACEVLPHLVKTPIEVAKFIHDRPYDPVLYKQQMEQMNQTVQN